MMVVVVSATMYCTNNLGTFVQRKTHLTRISFRHFRFFNFATFEAMLDEYSEKYLLL